MYDEILEIAENRAYLNNAKKDTFGPNMEILQTMPSYEELADLENELKSNNLITFDKIFNEPTGYYLMKCFLIADFSVDKAVFLKDCKLYKAMNDPSARLKIGRLIYDRFVGTDEGKYPKGQSVFDRQSKCKSKLEARNRLDAPTDTPSMKIPSEDDHMSLQLRIGDVNTIGVYGSTIEEVKEVLDGGDAPNTLFDEIIDEVLCDLRMDVFPRFLKSIFYRNYIRTKSIELLNVSHKDFVTLRMLGRGAFGAVNACIKKNTGKLYAAKCINKRRVMATDSVDNIMSERNVLALMDSRFVCCLNYAVQDHDMLYLMLDLMIGGDLKYHLNKEERFSETRSRFYAAQVLLGLEHIHSKGIIYRDIKLENILLDEKGNCRMTDLGLAVLTNDTVKGYAGTPGYTAPEVILMQQYNKMCDFFSFGVMVYRFLSGRKPFGSHTGSNDLDKNVVSVDPQFPSDFFTADAADLLSKLMVKDPRHRLGAKGIDEIKKHSWFAPIDWGLLEAGVLDPPFVPKTNPESLKHFGRPHHDEKYRRIRLTEEFQRSLDGFPFRSNLAVQNELVDVMMKADMDVNFEVVGQMTRDKQNDVSVPKGCCVVQ